MKNFVWMLLVVGVFVTAAFSLKSRVGGVVMGTVSPVKAASMAWKNKAAL